MVVTVTRYCDSESIWMNRNVSYLVSGTSETHDS
jgi:hypothetical protein